MMAWAARYGISTMKADHTSVGAGAAVRGTGRSVRSGAGVQGGCKRATASQRADSHPCKHPHVAALYCPEARSRYSTARSLAATSMMDSRSAVGCSEGAADGAVAGLQPSRGGPGQGAEAMDGRRACAPCCHAVRAAQVRLRAAALAASGAAAGTRAMPLTDGSQVGQRQENHVEHAQHLRVAEATGR